MMLVAALGICAHADEPVVADGIYWIYNVETDTYMVRNGWWGQMAVLESYGQPIVVTTTDGITTFSPYDAVEYWDSNQMIFCDPASTSMYCDGRPDNCEETSKFKIVPSGDYFVIQSVSKDCYLTIGVDEDVKYPCTIEGTTAETATKWRFYNGEQAKANIAAKEHSQFNALAIANNLPVLKDMASLTDTYAITDVTDQVTGIPTERGEAYEPGNWPGYRDASVDRLTFNIKVPQTGLYKIVVPAMYRMLWLGSTANLAAVDLDRYNNRIDANGFLAPICGVSTDPYDSETDGCGSYEVNGVKFYVPDNQNAFDVAAAEGRYANEVYAYANEGEEIIVKIQSRIGGMGWGNWLVYAPQLTKVYALTEKSGEALYNGLGETVSVWDEFWPKSKFPETRNIEVEVYQNYLIAKAFAGVEGYDLKVVFENGILVGMANIINGEEGEISFGPLQTGLSGDLATFTPDAEGEYLGITIKEDGTGDVFIEGYFGQTWSYYNLVWPQKEWKEGQIASSMGQTNQTEQWVGPYYPVVTNIYIEIYEGSFIARGFGGVEGYDLKVEFDANDNVTALTPIENGVEGKRVTKGYCAANTGNEEIPTINFYIGANYGYASGNATSGYICSSAYIGGTSDEDWGYYFMYWPEDWSVLEEKEVDIENPTLIYEANNGQTKQYAQWGTSTIPAVNDINVQVYDKYIRINGVAGVEGYDLLIVADPVDETVTAFIPVTNGSMGSPAFSYAYVYTGVEDTPYFQPYCGTYSYAASYDDKTGYALLGAYVYKADGSNSYNYYFIEWDGSVSGAPVVTVEQLDDAPIYNAAGQRVGEDYKGLIIRNGQKILNK